MTSPKKKSGVSKPPGSAPKPSHAASKSSLRLPLLSLVIAAVAVVGGLVFVSTGGSDRRSVGTPTPSDRAPEPSLEPIVDLRTPASFEIHQQVYAMVVRAMHRPLAEVTETYAIDPAYSETYGNIAAALLKGWHNSIERDATEDTGDYAITLATLIRAGGLSLFKACPLVDAIHYRNSVAVGMMIDTALHNPVPGKVDVDGLIHCFLEQDVYGQTLLHGAVKSKGAGFARIFVRARRLDKKFPEINHLQKMADTLDILKLSAPNLTEPLTFRGLNAITQDWDVAKLVETAHQLEIATANRSSGFNASVWLDIKDTNKMTAVHIAAAGGRLNALKRVLTPSSVQARGPMGYYAAHYCVAAASEECFGLVDEMDPQACTRVDLSNRTAVDLAAMLGEDRGGFITKFCPTDNFTLPHPVTTVPATTLESYLPLRTEDSRGWAGVNSTWLDAIGFNLTQILLTARGLVPVEPSASAFNRTYFKQMYAGLNRPVLVRKAVNITPRANVSRDSFVAEYGSVRVFPAIVPYADLYGIKKGRTRISDFVATIMSAHEGDVLPVSAPYIFDSRVLHDNPKMLTGIRFPLFAESDYDALLLKQLALGPVLSGAPPHFHQSAWNSVIVGCKLWWLFPPESTQFEGETAAWEWVKNDVYNGNANRKAFVAIQQAGDMMYVPENWGHAVLNLADTLAFAFEAVL